MRNVRELVVLASFVLLYTSHGLAEDYSYQPYPVLLLHGFNSTPLGTWGANTAKQDKKARQISTAVLEEAPFAGDNRKLGEDLTARFAAYSQYGRPKRSWIPSPLRYLPYEEEGSYTDENHRFVEFYCAFNSVESNDADGVDNPEFGLDGRSDYNIEDGGQEQLLRIRIIQLLNEYYGDFEWIGDPSAKLKLVGHSNGGALLTYFLQNDAKKDWYNNGENKQGISSDAIPNDGSYKIDGYGFVLRDHVDLAMTLNAPFDGTSFGPSTNIFNASDLSVTTFFALATGISVLSSDLFFRGDWLQGAFLIVWAATVAVIVEAIAEEWGFQGTANPLLVDDAPDSPFMKKVANNGYAPTYTNGQVIPYVNYTSNMRDLATAINLTGLIPAGFAGIQLAKTVCFAIPVCSPTLGPKAIYDMISGNTVQRMVVSGLMAATIWRLGGWMKNSDFVIPYESQDMRTVFKNPNVIVRSYRGKFPGRGRNHGSHNYLKKAVLEDWINDLNQVRDINISHVVGEEQAKEVTGTDDFAREDLEKRGFKFTGMDQVNTPKNDRWPVVDLESGAIKTNEQTGVPLYVVGKAQDYWLDKCKVECKVNWYDWASVPFRTDDLNGNFGRYASRYVDYDCNGVLDINDDLVGALYFAKVNPNHFLIGENLVRVRLTDSNGKVHTKSAQVKHAIERAVAFESDIEGNRTDRTLMFQSLSWTQGTARQVIFAFGKEIEKTETGFEIDAGEEELVSFTLGTGGNLAPGEYAFTPVTEKADQNYTMSVMIGYDDLRKDENGDAALEQTVVIRSSTLSSKNETKG